MNMRTIMCRALLIARPRIMGITWLELRMNPIDRSRQLSSRVQYVFYRKSLLFNQGLHLLGVLRTAIIDISFDRIDADDRQ